MTVVMVTHSYEVALLADRTLTIQKGHLIEGTSHQEILK
jgi:ABC-type lipoprotein export system ATPase subunit